MSIRTPQRWQQAASRPPYTPAHGAPVGPPQLWPVAVLTLAFGVFGGISAARRARRARAAGAVAGRYWWTYAGMLLVNLAVVVLPLFAAVVVPVWQGVERSARIKDLQSDIVQGGPFIVGGRALTASAATCTLWAPPSNGHHPYRCVVDFGDGGRRSFDIVVDPAGTWTVRALK